MLSALILENFKAFGEKTRIELAPITLIYGENSAGKTTILQALSLLKQTDESPGREANTALLPKVEAGLVDLGSFQELIFDHDLTQTLTIGLAVEPLENSEHDESLDSSPADGVGPFEMSFSFGQDRPTDDIELRGVGFRLEVSPSPYMEYEVRRLKEQEEKRLGPSWFSPRVRLSPTRGFRLVAECTTISQDESDWRALYEPWHSSRKLVAKFFSDQMAHTKALNDELNDPEFTGELSPYEESMVRTISFYEKSFTLEQFVNRIKKASYADLSLIDGFTPVGFSSFEYTAMPEAHFGAALNRVTPVRLPSLMFTENLAQASDHIRGELGALFPLGPFRHPPERWYMFSGTSSVDVGYQGEHLPDLLLKQKKLLRKANEWLDRLKIGYKLKPQRIGGRQSDLFSLRLEDTRRDTPVTVSLSDVGYGISQILPFLVQCLASERQTISIESPEVHIHPRLQADLGDLIAETVREPYNHQFLIETHSEHLVLRMQKLIRSGSLRPDDVSIIYVSRGEKGSKAQRLRLDDSGDFIDEWPGGFFPERMHEFR